jgi:hypothetical protein
VAGRPLRPATDPRLGRPLPCQLANRTQAPPQAPCGFLSGILLPLSHAVLVHLSAGYSPLRGRSLTYYSPVCHYLHLAKKTVRLACIKHAANVYPEPGSNSPQKRICPLQKNLLVEPSFRYPVVKVLCSLRNYLLYQSHPSLSTGSIIAFQRAYGTLYPLIQDKSKEGIPPSVSSSIFYYKATLNHTASALSFG